MGLFDGSGLSEYQDPPKPTMFDEAGIPTWDQHIQALADNHAYNPLQAASQVDQDHPDYSAAYEVDSLRKKTGNDPTKPGWGQVLKGAALALPKLAGGYIAAPYNAAAVYGDSALGGIENAIGDTDDATKNLQLAEKHKTIAAVQAQNSENSAEGTIGKVANFVGKGISKAYHFLNDNPDGSTNVVDPDTGEVSVATPEQNQQQAEIANKGNFDDRVKNFKTQSSLAQGQPVDTGLVAKAYQAIHGEPITEGTLSPQELAAQGTPLSTIDKLSMETGGMAADPTLLAYGKAGQIPGVSTVLKAGGTAMEAAGNAGAGLVKSTLGKVLVGGAGAGATGAGIYEYMHGGKEAVENMISNHPEALAVPLAATIAIGLGKIGGPIVREAGQLAGGEAIPETGAAGIRLRQGIAAGAGGAVLGAGTAAMDDPSAKSIVGGGLSGALTGFGMGAAESPQGAIQNNRAAILEAAGQNVQYGLGNDEEHQEQMQKLAPQDQAMVNKVRGITAGFTNADGSPMQVNVVSGPTFSAKAKAAGGQGNERGMWQDSSGIWINADSPANQAAGGATGTTGHEFGHLADNLSQALGDRMQGNFSQTLSDTLMPDGKPTEAFQKFIDGYSKARGQQIDPQTALQEFTEETARHVLGGGNIEQFTLPPTLMDQVKSGVGDWFKRMGIGVGNDKMFSWQEVPQVTSQLKDLFHEIGQTGYQNLQQGNDASQNPNARTELRQVQAQLDDLYSIPDKDKTSAHYNQIDQLENRQDTLERQMGISQWVPGTSATPEATSQATAPQTATPTPATPQTAPVAAPAQPTPTPTAPVSTPITPEVGPEKANLPQPKLPIYPNPDLPNAKPAIAPEVEDILPKSTATMEKPLPVDPTLPGTGQDVAPVPERTPEDIKGITDQAEQDAKDSDTWKRARSQNKKDDIIRQAKIKALVEELGPDESGLKKVTDEDGKETIQGHLDPENPIHQEIAKLAGVTQEQLENLNALHENEGNHTYVDYKSAPKNEGADFTGEQRETEYEKSTAQARASGNAQSQLQNNKSVVPISPKLSKDGKLIARFVSPDRILSNVRHVMDAAKENGIPTGYEGLTGDQLDKQVTQDFQDVVRNHKNGYTNTGKPFAKFGDTLAPNPNPDAVGIKIPQARADVINMALNDQGALGVTKPEGTKAHVKGNEAVNLARENQGYLNPETGETNALRDQLTQKGFDVNKTLEPTIENLKPELIQSVHSGIIGPKDIVRPSGFDIDTEAMTKGGLPNATMTRAGFMPDAATSNAESGTEKRLTPKELLASVRNAQPVAKSDSDTTPNGDGGAPSGSAVQAIEAAVRGSHEASQAAQLGFHEDKDAQFQALADAAKSNGLANAKLPQQWHPNRPDNVGGSEHDVFEDSPSDRFVKISKGAGYYPEATQRGWGMRAATPSEYFEKLKGLKDQWGLDTQIHGINLGHKESQPSFITSQPNIHPKLDAQGDPVRLSQPEITAHLAEKGFKPVGNEEDAMYYRPEDNMLIADAHPGNVIEKEDGTPSSFDTINIHPTGPLKDYVTRKMAPRPSDLNTRLKEALEKTFATSSAERWKDLDPEPTGTKKKELQLQP